MATKPSSRPAWTQGGGAGTRTEPSGAQKTAGMSASFKPPFEWINYVYGILSDWIDWFASGSDAIATPTANYVVADEIGAVFINPPAAGGNKDVTLPDPASFPGRKIRVMNVNYTTGDTDTTTVKVPSGKKLANTTNGTHVLGAGEGGSYQSDGTDWHVWA